MAGGPFDVVSEREVCGAGVETQPASTETKTNETVGNIIFDIMDFILGYLFIVLGALSEEL